MQASTAPAQAPAAPAAPAQGRAVVTVTNADGTTQTLAIPLTKQDVDDIRARREELSSQLISANGRRRRLADELRMQPEGAARAGIEGRLVVLDTRLAQLETDIATTGRQLSAAPRGLTTSEGISLNSDMPANAAPVAFVVLVLFPIAIAYARKLWKGGGRTPAPAALSAESGQRLERLEQGMDAIAIEIERVAEGQRFVTRLLSEGTASVKLPGTKVADEIRVQTTGR